MTKAEVEDILREVLALEPITHEAPTDADWTELQEHFATEFPEEFIHFIDLMATYVFPGDVLSVPGRVRTNGNDTITATYEFERNQHSWREELIPFYSIGNGDYFALNAREGRHTAVYYVFHEDARVELHTSGFAEWVRHLPEFLN